MHESTSKVHIIEIHLIPCEQKWETLSLQISQFR